MSSLNAIGTAMYCGQTMGSGEGGNEDRGDIDQHMPTAIMASGQDVSSKDDFRKGVRKEMSSTRNAEIYRDRGRR